MSSSQAVDTFDLSALLCRLRSIETVRRNSGIQRHLEDLTSKLSAGRLNVAVLGQMKRGKSSLINALLGADVLPTGVLPATAVITAIEYGTAPKARVVSAANGERMDISLSQLADFITEAGNPRNCRQVAAVEIEYPSPLLQAGITIVDTPGIGSTHLHNTDTTQQYLQHVDAGLVVLSVDPAITEVEGQFITQLMKEMPKLFFILNKIDLVSSQERAELVGFLNEELTRLGARDAEIVALASRPSARGTSQLGLHAFQERLQGFLTAQKQDVLAQSVAADTLDIARALRFCIAISAGIGTFDAHSLQAAKTVVQVALTGARKSARELKLLLRQSSADIVATVEADLETMAQSSAPTLRIRLAQFRTEGSALRGRLFGTALERALLDNVEVIFQRWIAAEDSIISQQLAELSRRFQKEADAIFARLTTALRRIIDLPAEELRVRCTLTFESHLRLHIEPIFYSLDSFLLLLPRFLMRPIVLRKAERNIPDLLGMNAGRVRYDYLERIERSIGRFEKELLRALDNVMDGLALTLESTPRETQDPSTDLATLNQVIASCSTFLAASRFTP